MRSQQAQARIDEEQRAIPFRCTREAHHTEIAEDYVELIAELIDGQGEARGVDIARRLGVTQATVASTVARLQRDRLGRVRALPLDLPYRGGARARRAVPTAA